MVSDLNNKVIEFISDLVNNRRNDNDLILIKDLGFYLSDLLELKRLKNNHYDNKAYDLEVEMAKEYRNYAFMDLVMQYNMVNRYNELLNDILEY